MLRTTFLLLLAILATTLTLVAGSPMNVQELQAGKSLTSEFAQLGIEHTPLPQEPGAGVRRFRAVVDKIKEQNEQKTGAGRFSSIVGKVVKERKLERTSKLTKAQWEEALQGLQGQRSGGEATGRFAGDDRPGAMDIQRGTNF